MYEGVLSAAVTGSDPHAVYGSASGLRARLASPMARSARRRRHEEFFAATGLRPGMRVLDVGTGAMGLRALEPQLDVTGVDLIPQPAYPGVHVVADAATGLPFGDDEFDLVYCNSVIEHVPPARRPAFAAEIRRVGRGWYVQTPARSFPVEPHALLPFAHWLPERARRAYWHLGVQGYWEDIRLLGRGEMESLFGPARPERLAGLVKSWIVVRPIGTAE